MLPKRLKNGFVRIAGLWVFVFLLCPYMLKAQSTSPYRVQYKKFTTVDSTKLDIKVYPSLKHQEKAPAIIFFHGGGWYKGSIRQFKPQAQYFAQRGITGLVVDYRIASRDHTTIYDAVYDAVDAVKYIIQHAKKFGINPHKIILCGGSAGGHLALISAFQLKGELRNFNTVAMVLFNPVINTGPNGYGYRRLRDSYRLIDPIEHIPVNPPPAILFYGTKDQFIPEKQAKDFCQLYKAQGGICALKFYKGQRHGFWNYRRKEKQYFIETMRQADRFLIKQGIIGGKPDVKKWLQNQDK